MDNSQSIHLCGSVVGARPHICAFFRNPAEEHRVLLPFVQEGLLNGEKVFQAVDPQRLEQQVYWLNSAGIDVAGLRRSGQLELRPWTDIYLRGGAFDWRWTFDFYGTVVDDARAQGYPRVRFITHMGWALQDLPGVDDLLEYEARANDPCLRHDGLLSPVICTYELTRFSGEFVVDIIQTHPIVIISGVLHENPFFVPPDEYVRQRRERLAGVRLSTFHAG